MPSDYRTLLAQLAGICADAIAVGKIGCSLSVDTQQEHKQGILVQYDSSCYGIIGIDDYFTDDERLPLKSEKGPPLPDPFIHYRIVVDGKQVERWGFRGDCESCKPLVVQFLSSLLVWRLACALNANRLSDGLTDKSAKNLCENR